MATTISNGESGSSVRTKLNNIWEGLQINEIASTISDTAVDIFVYDTRKDSDAGAWRKRTQATSWYNETLNTATRGSRKEFPAVAVIVAESTQVTIYDGDDPDLPMWYVFNRDTSTPDSNTAWWRSASTIVASSVAMLNGKLGIALKGAASDNCCLITADFCADVLSSVTPNAAKSNTGSPISEALNVSLPNKLDQTIVAQQVNDIAMTVLPNAPIDAATGLPVPTIAVATDGGVSVIKDDGTVVDDTTFSPINVISFGIDDDVFYGRNGFGRVYKWDYLADTSSTATYVTNATNPPIAGNTNGGIVDFGNDEYWASGGTTDGLNVFAENKLAANITSEFNTGWMNGDIKLATLSDTTVESVAGAEGLTGSWATPSGYDNTTSGTGTSVTGTGNTTQTRSYLVVDGVDIGETFVVEVTIDTLSSGSMTIYARTGTTGTGGSFIGSQGSATAGNTYTFTVTATTDDFNLLLVTNTNGADFTATCSVRLAEEDRSVNGNGLQVFTTNGNINKNPVATGSDLVAYSGFSGASNPRYLQQPNNPDLEFDDTDTFSCMIWFKSTTTSDQFYRFRDLSDTGGMHNFLINTNGEIRWGGYGTTSSTTDVLDGNIVVNDGNWHFAVGVKTPETWSIYVDGKFDNSMAVAATGNYYGSSSVLRIGLTQGNGNSAGGVSMALLRISATAPSPEQIKYIYESEKVLFQEGAQATLYGSSDAVTALAYDDSTELLHVGTSAGRSVFQGLRRVDNTTTAVGAAISASNGLVADE